MTENGFKTRVKIIGAGLTHDLRKVEIGRLRETIDLIDAPDPLCLLLTLEQREALKAAAE